MSRIFNVVEYPNETTNEVVHRFYSNLILRFCSYARGVPTVCVTCAGAGTAKPSDLKNEKA